MIEYFIAIMFYGYDVTFKHVAFDVAMIAGIVTGVGIIYTKAVTPAFCFAREHFRKVNRLVTDVSKVLSLHEVVDLKQIAKDVGDIKHDMKPNSGMSMRDAVDRIEGEITRLSDEQTRIARIQWAIRQDGPFGLFRCTMDGKNIEVNRTYCRWLGVGADELMGHGWRKFLDSDSQREDYDDEWTTAFAQGRELEFKISFRAATGEVRTFEVKTYPLPTRGGEVLEYLGILTPEVKGSTVSMDV